uniref:Reverse transcriptase domain-containing protein n=1 Tax=Tanacetum cinerariifolium TaxID=118510 RepID=A0A699IRW8_TANCI|nr:reverse transcriptase domain-containing protein [Tanacetum cinerariifolium]
MSATRHGMNSAKIDQIIAQRVTDAIKAIVLYEEKIHMAHDSMNQVQQNKRLEVVKAHTTGPCNKKWYARNLPTCDRCKLTHTGPCIVRCNNCKRVGHMTRDCKTPVLVTTQRSIVANQKSKVTCYECEKPGHYKSDCPKWKNQNRVNQIWKVKARGNSNVVKNNDDARGEIFLPYIVRPKLKPSRTIFCTFL